MNREFDTEMMEKWQTDNKVGLLAVADGDGYPHMVFINTVMAFSARELTWGQFIQGYSKRRIPEEKRTAFVVLNRQMELWRGKAEWNRMETIGAAFEQYNNKPLFRYNSYFGIGQVHFMDLVGVTPCEKLSVAAIAGGGVCSRLAAPAVKKTENGAMNTITLGLFSKIDSLKFLAYMDKDGFPWVVPCIQMAPAGSDRLVFSLVGYGDELKNVPPGAKVGVFCATLTLETVMVKGTFIGIARHGAVKSGLVEVERVYNTMPPESGYIYPRPPLAAVRVSREDAHAQ